MINEAFKAKYGEALRGVRVGILTPTIRGYCPSYAMSMWQTTLFATELGARVESIAMVGQSCLPLGRNWLVHAALKRQAAGDGFDYQFHIDDDVGWSAYDFWQCVALCVMRGHKVLAGNYPKKEVLWDRVAAYVNDKFESCHPDTEVTVDELRRVSQHFAANMPEEVDIDDDGTCAMQGLPMGWACIHHSVFRDVSQHLPSYIDRTDNEEVFEWFDDRHVGPMKKGVYVSEDISFFHHLVKHGVKVRCLTTAELTHTGQHTWRGAPIDEYDPRRK